MYAVKFHFYFSCSTKWVQVQHGVLGIYDEEGEENPSDFVLLRTGDTTVNEILSASSPYKFQLKTSSHGHYKDFQISTDTEEERKKLVQLIQGQIDKTPAVRDEDHPICTTEDNEELFKLRVCSYNVNFGCCGFSHYDEFEESIYTALMKTECDVVLFQETTPEWETYFCEYKTYVNLFELTCLTQLYVTRLDEKYPYHEFQHYEIPYGLRRPEAGGIAIMSKFRILSCDLIMSPCNWFPAQLSVIETPIGNIQLMNLHLRPPLTDSALPLPHAYFYSKSDRKKEVQWFGTFLQPNLPTVVCGDFNEDSGASSCTHWTSNLKMRSALDEYKGKKTWWWKLPGGIIIKARFDHIFYNGLVCTTAHVIPEGLSDHYPVYADFHTVPVPHKQ